MTNVRLGAILAERNDVNMLLIGFIGAVGSLVSYLTTKIILSGASQWGMLDSPNARSAHTIPTPKGGGLSFFFSFMALLFLYLFFGRVDLQVVGPLIYGAPVVVCLGLMDDRFSLSASLRLGVHFLVAVVIFGLVTNWAAINFKISFLPDVMILNATFCILFIAWFINLFNFMDGADGLVTSVSLVAALLLAVITYFHGASSIAAIYVAIACCVGGFLPHNWYPAKIFMGDTGSYFLGFVFATLALICKIHSNISFYSHIVIFAPFIADTTYTLLVRLFRGEKIYHAHRQQAFHKIVDKGWSHQKVSFLFIIFTIVWLFPLAHLASIYDIWGLVFVLIGYAPVLAFEIFHKAGFKEERS